mgnify:CR=1 FL=1
MSKKEEFFKERFKQALDSTYKVISEELHNLSKKENLKDIEDYNCLLYTSPSPRDP